MKEERKTKTKSKVHVISTKSTAAHNSESDEEADYDLETCIEESGGTDHFIHKPSMILYKKNLKNQG